MAHRVKRDPREQAIMDCLTAMSRTLRPGDGDHPAVIRIWLTLRMMLDNARDSDIPMLPDGGSIYLGSMTREAKRLTRETGIAPHGLIMTTDEGDLRVHVDPKLHTATYTMNGIPVSFKKAVRIIEEKKM